ncbi:MAG: 2-acyl-glycerophospho-ethanolamine acyltransferase [Schlesneria sp.]|nr:2-acyl-glycerophospho-ethanolamine acyltransferase [Schlesneria sp.]
MASTTLPADQDNSHPPLLQDRSFWGLNLTQFLGAFNDNLFKQLVLLLCIDRAREGGSDAQGLAMILFAWPFIAFSGFAGFLSDRYSKRTIIVLCKAAEFVIVLLGMAGFMSGNLSVLMGVLCLMGVHSAFFGPSKYGILPELLRTSDLPRANGSMLMATFLAIIFGLSAAGAAKHAFNDHLWIASLPCLIIAVTGLATSLLIRPTPVAQPGLRFDWTSVAIPTETRKLLMKDRTLLGVLLMSSVFWFVGGTVYPPAINAFGKKQLGLNDLTTGIMAATTGLGIAVGCVLAGMLSKNRVRGWMIRMGAWGLTASLAALCLPGPGFDAVRDEIRQAKQAVSQKVQAADSSKTKSEPAAVAKVDPFRRGSLLGPYGSVVALISVGLFAGFFSVPLQVYLQAAAPSDQKGRIIGAMNLLNWIGIAGSGGVYFVGQLILINWLELPPASLFGFAALLMLPVALFYRPPEREI